MCRSFSHLKINLASRRLKFADKYVDFKILNFLVRPFSICILAINETDSMDVYNGNGKLFDERDMGRK